MSKQLMVTPVPDKTKPVEGKEYFFVRFNSKDPNATAFTIHQGTCVRCDKCKKAFIVNAAQVTSFNQRSGELRLPVNTYLTNAQELAGCHEESGGVYCEKCYPYEDDLGLPADDTTPESPLLGGIRNDK